MQSPANWNGNNWLSVKTRREKDQQSEVDFSDDSLIRKIIAQLKINHKFSRHRTERKNKRKIAIQGKVEKFEHDITVGDLFCVYKAQKGKCNLSGIIMLLGDIGENNRVFKLSVNRIDNKKGYTKNNIELVCLGFNSTDVSIKQIISKGQ